MPAKVGRLTVSVLLPTFNRARYISEAIDSVRAQTRAPLEIIVIDDGSSDDTEAVCRAFGQSITYIKQPSNAGKSAAINRGLSLARGDAIWVMDDDDVAPIDALETLVAPLEADAELGFTFGRLWKFSEPVPGDKQFDPSPIVYQNDERSVFVRLMEDCFITGQPCALIRRVCFDQIGRIDETVQVSVDYNILLQVARRYRGADVGRVVLWQRQHDGVRGPAARQYGANERVSRWKASDARLLSELMQSLQLGEYIGYLPSWTQLTPRERRRAFFQKAVVAARKELWIEACAALRDARSVETNAHLAWQDRVILAQLLGSRYGIESFIDNIALQGALYMSAGRGRVGRSVRFEIASRLTYWIGQALRAGDWLRAGKTAIALIRLGRWDLGGLLMRPLTKRFSAKAERPAPGREAPTIASRRA